MFSYKCDHISFFKLLCIHIQWQHQHANTTVVALLLIKVFIAEVIMTLSTLCSSVCHLVYFTSSTYYYDYIRLWFHSVLFLLLFSGFFFFVFFFFLFVAAMSVCMFVKHLHVICTIHNLQLCLKGKKEKKKKLLVTFLKTPSITVSTHKKDEHHTHTQYWSRNEPYPSLRWQQQQIYVSDICTHNTSKCSKIFPRVF